MSYQKAADLLRLAEMASARYLGISLPDIEEEFGVNHRTAQRMTRSLEEIFPNCTTKTDEERRKFWSLDGSQSRLMLAQGIRDNELAALDIAIEKAGLDGDDNHVKALHSLRDRLLGAMPGPHARRAEADAEAQLEAYGFASRPGPQMRSRPKLLAVITEAFKGPHQLRITYKGSGTTEDKDRIIEPHGLLLGTRRYLVAREPGRDRKLRHYRLDRIMAAYLTASSFVKDPTFDLNEHAANAFGSYHSEDEYGEVVWRFAPSAAEVVKDFIFHPKQEMSDEPDGSVLVRFQAAGHLEMAWHLYQWGDAVEVVAPASLREMTQDFRRSDFAALP